MALTQQEELELQTLEKEFGTPSVGALTPDEEKELALLESEFSGTPAPTPVPQPQPTPTVEQPTEQGLLERLTGRFEKAVPPRDTVREQIFSELFGPAIAGGQAIGAIGDVIGSGISSIFKNVVPDKAQEFIKSGVRSIVETDIGQAGLSALQGGTELYQEFKTNNPETALAIESIFNIATAVPVTKFGKPVVKETFDIAGDITDVVTRKSIKTLDNQISSTINSRLPKAIQPKTTGRKTSTQIKTFQAKSRSAVEEVIANKNNLKFIDETGQEVIGRLPQNLDEFGQAITQTKGKIFTEFDALAKMAGQRGAKVNTQKIAKELDIIANDSRINRLTPSTATEAKRLSDSFADVVDFSPLEAEKELEILNRTLKAFYDNPTPDSASVAYVHSLVANNIRKQLDDVITSAGGENFKELKRAYGALRSIEEDVGGAIFREAKKGNPGLVVDFGNVLSSTAALQGILTSNPKLAIAAGLGKTVVDTFKKLREPSRLVNKMFNEVDDLTIKRNDFGFNPKSKLNQILQKQISQARTARPDVEQVSPQDITGFLKGGREPITERGFQLIEKKPTIFQDIAPKTKIKQTAIPKGKAITTKSVLTGDKFIDSKISIALSTPPSLRDAEQKFIIDLITRRQ